MVPFVKDVDVRDASGRSAAQIASMQLESRLERVERQQQSAATRSAQTGRTRQLAISEDAICCDLEECIMLLKAAGADLTAGVERRRPASADSRNGSAKRHNALKIGLEGSAWVKVLEEGAMWHLKRVLARRACPWEACSGRGGRSLQEVVNLYKKWGLFAGEMLSIGPTAGGRA